MERMVAGGLNPSNPQHHHLTSCLLMTASDLSDQTKDWVNSKKIAELVYTEFFSQGDLEKAMGNKPVESMDREKAFIPTLQIQFIDHIVIPVYRLVILNTLWLKIRLLLVESLLTWMVKQRSHTSQSWKTKNIGKLWGTFWRKEV